MHIMCYTVTQKTPLQYSIDGEQKYKFVISDKYVALWWKSLKMPIIYDKEYEEQLSKYNFYQQHNGYAATHKTGESYMHAIILYEVLKFEKNADVSIDHINWYKTDNRRDNLRLATQSEQNSNRQVRSDKKPPPEELIQNGIKSLPRYVRWDKTEHKFVIEKHPVLIERYILNGMKASMSGRKSSKLTMTQKYDDILEKLKQLNAQCDYTLENQRIKLRNEYIDICNTIYTYEGIASIAKGND